MTGQPRGSRLSLSTGIGDSDGGRTRVEGKVERKNRTCGEEKGEIGETG